MKPPAVQEKHRCRKPAAVLLAGLFFLLAAPGPASASASKPRPCDPALAITPDDALKRLKGEPDLVLADVRSPAEYARLRIAGSLGIPLAFLRSKSFLKARSVILVGDGFRNSALLEECRRLRQEGIDAALLDGGLAAWSLKGYPLQGDRLELSALRRVSPQVAHQERGRTAVTVLAFSRELRPENPTAFGSLVHFPAGFTDPGSAARLKAAVARTGCLEPVLVATEAGDGYDLLARQLSDAGISAFFLDGGLTAYRRHIEELSLSWGSREKRLRTVSACRPCGEKPATAEKAQE
jgi:rhodanese-related sulfurtransferase